mgnify:CR=1 FL=1
MAKRVQAPWIRMRTGLPDDPAVIRMAAALKIEDDAVVGKLHRLWAWATTNLADGNAAGVTDAWVDRYVKCDGFARMLCAEGWLRISADGLSFPNWERYLSEGSKQRALTARRVASHRDGDTDSVTEEKRECNAASVTGSISISTSISKSSSGTEKSAKSQNGKLSVDEAAVHPLPMTWPEDLRAAFVAFIRNQYALRKPRTAHAIDLLIANVEKIPNGLRVDAVNQSIANGYQGIFPPKASGSSQAGADDRRAQRRATEYTEPKTAGPRIIRFGQQNGAAQ